MLIPLRCFAVPQEGRSNKYQEYLEPVFSLLHRSPGIEGVLLFFARLNLLKTVFPLLRQHNLKVLAILYQLAWENVVDQAIELQALAKGPLTSN